MSYDIHMEANLGAGPVRLDVLRDWNYTCNVAPMLQEAGIRLPDFDLKTAHECLPVLLAGIAVMEGDPDRFRALNPSNGWGSYDGILRRLRELVEAFQTAPIATVRVT